MPGEAGMNDEDAIRAATLDYVEGWFDGDAGRMERALDPELVAEVLSLVRELALGGMTMLIATHEMGFARDIASRVCFLDAGRILEEGPPEQIFRAPREERTQRFLQRVMEAGRL